MEKRVRLVLSVKTIKNELSPEEREPHLNMFLDARFWRRPASVKLDAGRVVVEGRLPPQHSGKLPQTASLVISGWALRPNDQGTKCWMDIGTNHLSLAKIAQNGGGQVDVPLVMHTVQNYEKAVVRVKIEEADFPGIEFVNHKFIGDGIMSYVNATFQNERRMKDTIPGTGNMRVPYDYSESGVELTGGMPLPAIGYVMSETPESNTEFWQNTFQVVMERDGMDPADWPRLDKNSKARVMALMVCYVAQYLDYVSDTIDRNKMNEQFVKGKIQGCENFGDSLVTWSGDCEDLGTGILQSYNSFVSCKIQDKTLLEIRAIAAQYIPILSLDVVNGAQVIDKNAPKGAHMNINLVPIAEFRRWMRKTASGRELDKKIAHVYPKEIDNELPFMVGEGTGKLEPLGYNNPNLAAMGYVYRLPALKTFKKPIPRTRTDAGQFLLGSLTGFTDYFIRRHAMTIGSMWYVTSHMLSAEVTRGAYYNDMINDRERVGVLMHDPVPKPTMAVIKEAVMLRDPPHPLILTTKSEEKYAEMERNKHLDYLVNYVRDFGREKDIGKAVAVPVYIRAQQISRKLTSDLAAQLSGLSRICKVEYKLERITDQIAGYEIKIYVDTSK